MKQVLPRFRRPTTRFVAADFVRLVAGVLEEDEVVVAVDDEDTSLDVAAFDEVST